MLGLASCGLAAAGQQTQTPPPAKPEQKTAAKPSGVATADAVPGPQQTKHYPILVLGHGIDPVWSLRLGMKGPERLDRANYPPMVLEPGEIARDEAGTTWTYHAKDSATGATLTVKLTREACAEGTSEVKYTFRMVVEHTQVGTLSGCGQSAPDKFPEFRKKNQLDPDENAEAGDKDKKTVLDPITNFKSPTAVAYVDAAGNVILSRGASKKTVAATGYELALSHDGRKLLYTRDLSKSGPERAIMLYEVDTGRAKELVSGLVRQAFWSPDDTRVAYLKFDEQQWHVWELPVAAPEKAAQLSSIYVTALQGWISAGEVLATSLENAYWIGEDGKAEKTIPLKTIYGDAFQIMSSDTLRANPINPDVLLVTAYYKTTPTGSPVDSMGLNSTFFLYEVRSGRRTLLCPTDTLARGAEWSRDGLQIFYTKRGPGKTVSTNRMFWDGSGQKRYESGSNLVVGK